MSKLKILLVVLFVSTSVHAEYTAQEMCDSIPRLYRAKQVHVFFDAKDRAGPLGSVRKKEEMKTFSLEVPLAGGTILWTRLGEIFRGFASGIGFYTTYENIYFQQANTPEGRVLTKIFGFPKKVPSTSTEPGWKNYQLCRYEPCPFEGMEKGEWKAVSRYVDTVSMKHGDVFALYYNRERVPPSLDCLPDRIVIGDGELDRQ